MLVVVGFRLAWLSLTGCGGLEWSLDSVGVCVVPADFVRLLFVILFLRSCSGGSILTYGCRCLTSGLMLGCCPYALGGVSCCTVAAGCLCSSSGVGESYVAGRAGYSIGCLGSAWICAVWWITILSPSGDCGES